MYTKQNLICPQSNLDNGQYRPAFFTLEQYALSSVNIQAVEFNEADLIDKIKDCSFTYLRENYVKRVTVQKLDGEKIPFEEFCKHFGIKINSENLFKTGKYLSRVFRPVRYGGFFKDLKIHVNENMKGKVIDGISLISPKLAKDLGLRKVKAGMSGQFTLFFKEGLVKGHYVISSKIEHDVVVYKDNIKTEIKYDFKDLAYISIEPVKLTKHLKLDIQTLLNIWDGFGKEDFFDWGVSAIHKFTSDLKSGKLAKWIMNSVMKNQDLDSNEWILIKAIFNGIDYRDYPGLLRHAWRAFKNSIMRIAVDKHGNPSFRIPIDGFRAYIRPDLRNHDKDGNFTLSKDKTKITVDRFGNAWINAPIKRLEEILEILGGADFDDGVGIIPLASKALIYRNPNQKGEVIIEDVIFQVKINRRYLLSKELKSKKVIKKQESKEKFKYDTDNDLIKKYLILFEGKEAVERYSIVNILRTMSRIVKNSTSIGYVANAEMIRSAIGIINQKLMNRIINKYKWNLERVIDATVKDGINCSEDFDLVQEFYEQITKDQIPIPKTLLNRIPARYREQVKIAKNHPLDELFDALKYVIEDTDLKILGKGTGDSRIKGWIDSIEPPIELITPIKDNPMKDIALEMLKEYNSKVAELMRKCNESNVFDKTEFENIKDELLTKMNNYNNKERKLIVKVWAEEIYKSSGHIHDSILWLCGKGIRGTADDMIDVLTELGLTKSHKIPTNNLKEIEITENVCMLIEN